MVSELQGQCCLVCAPSPNLWPGIARRQQRGTKWRVFFFDIPSSNDDNSWLDFEPETLRRLHVCFDRWLTEHASRTDRRWAVLGVAEYVRIHGLEPRMTQRDIEALQALVPEAQQMLGVERREHPLSHQDVSAMMYCFPGDPAEDRAAHPEPPRPIDAHVTYEGSRAEEPCLDEQVAIAVNGLGAGTLKSIVEKITTWPQGSKAKDRNSQTLRVLQTGVFAELTDEGLPGQYCLRSRLEATQTCVRDLFTWDTYAQFHVTPRTWEELGKRCCPVTLHEVTKTCFLAGLVKSTHQSLRNKRVDFNAFREGGDIEVSLADERHTAQAHTLCGAARILSTAIARDAWLAHSNSESYFNIVISNDSSPTVRSLVGNRMSGNHWICLVVVTVPGRGVFLLVVDTLHDRPGCAYQPLLNMCHHLVRMQIVMVSLPKGSKQLVNTCGWHVEQIYLALHQHMVLSREDGIRSLLQQLELTNLLDGPELVHNDQNAHAIPDAGPEFVHLDQNAHAIPYACPEFVHDDQNAHAIPDACPEFVHFDQNAHAIPDACPELVHDDQNAHAIPDACPELVHVDQNAHAIPDACPELVHDDQNAHAIPDACPEFVHVDQYAPAIEECPTCAADIPVGDIIICSEGIHIACLVCYGEYIQQPNTPPTCVEPDCPGCFRVQDLKRLDDQALLAYMQKRISRAEQDGAGQRDSEAKAKQSQTRMERARGELTTALSCGCPECGVANELKDGCCSIQCSNCSTYYCYICN